MVTTKIIATLGPSSSSETMLKKMIFAGLDVVRLNFSHGILDDHAKRVEIIRNLNKKYSRSIKIMQDLEGFRIRLGRLKKPVELKKRQILFLTKEEILGSENAVHFDYKGDLSYFKKNGLIFIDDGRIILKIKDIARDRIKTEVVNTGILKERKGVNIPDVKLSFGPFTEKDKQDVEFAIDEKLDYVAQSFVRNRRDIIALRDIIKGRHPRCKIFSKIESREALASIDGIIEESDGVIIARGDLGVCVQIYKVALIQKEIIRKCRKAMKPVIVATQMLESMTEELIPTRAEVSDVTNAILDGSSGVLLSAETAIGKHPDQVILMANSIIKYTEDYIRKINLKF